MIEKVDILQHSEGSHLDFHSGKEAAWFLGMVHALQVSGFKQIQLYGSTQVTYSSHYMFNFL